MKTKLLELRKQKGVLQKDVANACGLSTRAYGSYEADEREPSLTVLIALADYFKVTVDELLGRNANHLETQDNSAFGETLRLLRIQSNMTQLEVANILDIPRTTYRNYEVGASQMDYELLIRTAKLFNTTVDELLKSKRELDNEIAENQHEQSQIVGDNLKAFRLKSNLTQLEVASKLGIPRTTYTHYETGRSEMDYDLICKVAEIFNVSVEDLFVTKLQSTISKLKELRNARKLTQKQVADNVGIGLQAYSYYERGEREPSFDILKKLADFFSVSIDDILGYAGKQSDNRFVEARENCNLTQKEVATKLGIQNTAVSKWETGITIPDGRMLKRVAELYGVSSDYLLGIETSHEEMLNLKNYRKKLSITQKDLANILGVATSTFSGWESGKYEIDNTNLKKLSNILGVSTDFLLDIDQSVIHSSELQAIYEMLPSALQDNLLHYARGMSSAYKYGTFIQN